jgi:hypothetical protein
MNKHLFIVLSLVLLFFFACDLQIPTAVEIRGTPELAFPANMDIAGMFSDMLTGISGEAENLTLIHCKNTAIQTYMAYLDLLKKEGVSLGLPNLSGLGIFAEDEITEDMDLFDDLPFITIPLASINEHLKGFTLSDAKIIIYTYSNKQGVLDSLSIGVTVKSGSEQLPEQLIENIKNGKSAHASWTDNVYPGTSVPNDGNIINLPLSCSDTDIKFRVFIPEGTVISSTNFANFSTAEVTIEVVFWLPFILKAGPDGGTLNLPDLFSSDQDPPAPPKDLFGREEAGSENLIFDVVESIELIFRLSHPIFSKATLVVTSQPPTASKAIVIENLLEGNSLSFSIDESIMSQINDPDNWPFAPQLVIDFPPGQTLQFPNGLKTKELAFKAKIKHRIDL